MRRCNEHNAVKLLTDNMKNSILLVNELNKSIHLHANIDQEVLAPEKPKEAHSIKFTTIEEEGEKLHSKQEQ